MSKISSLLTKSFRNINFIIVILLVLILQVSGQEWQKHLHQAVLAVFYSPFATIESFYEEISGDAVLNDELLAQISELELNLAVYEEAKKENERLRDALSFKERYEYSLIPAKVISVKEGRIPTTAVINRGSNDSVGLDMAVINQHGLVGKISFVTPDYSIVQLLTETTNHIAARLNQSRITGLVKYEYKNGMILDNYPIQGEVNVGDTVISSGLGGVYPAKLLVGFVKKVERIELNPFYEISIEPAVNFYSIEELFIIKDTIR